MNFNREEILSAMEAGTIDLVLITPETLLKDEIQEVITKIDIGLLVIDETHCISDLGHDFRLEYTRLNRIVQKMPHTVSVLGTTKKAVHGVARQTVSVMRSYLYFAGISQSTKEIRS